MPMIRTRLLAGAIAAAVFAVHTGTGRAFDYVITKVADTETQVPGRPAGETFTGFGTPSYHGFVGTSASGVGVYDHTRVRIADNTTPVPGGAGTFTGFSAPVEGGGPSVARGTGTNGQEGVYALDRFGNNSKVIADRTTPVPDGGGSNFSSFGHVDGIFGPRAFYAQGTAIGLRGIYGSDPFGAGGPALRRFADTRVGDFAFSDLRGPAVGPGDVAYTGFNSTYRAVVRVPLFAADNPVLVADTNTDIPGGVGRFTDFTHVDVVDGAGDAGGHGPVVFVGHGENGQSGIYSGGGRFGQSSLPALVVDSNTPIPGGAGTFTGFRAVNYTGGPLNFGGLVTFLATGEGGQLGIYGYPERGIQAELIVARGSVLDGKTVANLSLADNAQFNVATAFKAEFTDGSSGIYVAVYPEPSAGVLLGCFAAAALLARRGRRAPGVGLNGLAPLRFPSQPLSTAR